MKDLTKRVADIELFDELDLSNIIDSFSDLMVVFNANVGEQWLMSLESERAKIADTSHVVFRVLSTLTQLQQLIELAKEKTKSDNLMRPY